MSPASCGTGEKCCHGSRPCERVLTGTGIFDQASRAVVKISEPKDGVDLGLD